MDWDNWQPATFREVWWGWAIVYLGCILWTAGIWWLITR